MQRRRTLLSAGAACLLLMTGCTSQVHGVAATSSTPATTTASSSTTSSAPSSPSSSPSPSASATPTVASLTPSASPRSTTAGRRELSASQVLAIAIKDATDFASYDYRTLDAHKSLVDSELTPEFAGQYNTTFASLAKPIKQEEAVATVTGVSGRVQKYATTGAVDVVTLTQHVHSYTAGKTQSAEQRVTMTLLPQPDGRWLLASLSLS